MADIKSERSAESKSEVSSLESSGGRRMRAKRSNVDIEGVFEIDGFESREEQAFDESEEEHTSCDSGDDTPPVNMQRKSGTAMKTYASSLPIKVPLWTLNHDDKSEDEDKVSSFEGPERIAESFRKACAMSVRDGTEMFGDLPRRRLNTGDLVKSRPI